METRLQHSRASISQKMGYSRKKQGESSSAVDIEFTGISNE